MSSWGPTHSDEDSGVPMPGANVAIWNEIEAGRKQEAELPPPHVIVDAVAFLAEIGGRAMAIARNKGNDPLARATALEVARKAAMDQLAFGQPK